MAIVEADCKDKICVKSEYIENIGKSLICLPHKLVMEIKRKQENEYDIMVAY